MILHLWCFVKEKIMSVLYLSHNCLFFMINEVKRRFARESVCITPLPLHPTSQISGTLSNAGGFPAQLTRKRTRIREKKSGDNFVKAEDSLNFPDNRKVSFGTIYQ